MTNEKARDFFSAYHEGSLDAALRPGFEQKLASDPAFRNEYARFEATLRQLSELRETVIEVPFDLNERIATRLDRHLWEQKQAAPSSIFGRMRTFAFGGLAVAALAAAAFSIRHFSDGPSQAGIATIGVEQPMAVVMKQDAVTVIYTPVNKCIVVFRTQPDDKKFAEVPIDRTMPLNRRIGNANPATEVISIEVSDAPKVDRVILALPGTRAERVKAGSGTLEDFAKALAGKYRSPVRITRVGDPLIQVSWDFDATDARQAAEAALKGGRFSVDQRDGNLITISQN